LLHLAVADGDGEGWESGHYGSDQPRWFVRHRETQLHELLASAGWHIVEVSRLSHGRDWLYLLAHRG
jgi:hypothetical protein